MAIKVRLFSPLKDFTDGQSVVDGFGDTLGACLKDLTMRFPKLKRLLFDNNNVIRPVVLISVNKMIATSKLLDEQLKDGDELYIVLVAGGG
jgi:molybdopterin converting factor small subunit